MRTTMTPMLVAGSVIVLSLWLVVAQIYPDPLSPTWQRYRPLIGGMQIQRRLNETHVARCTLGYAANHTVWGRGIVTAAHCVNFSRLVNVYQNVTTNENLIGYSDHVNASTDFVFVSLLPGVNAEQRVLHIYNLSTGYYPVNRTLNYYDGPPLYCFSSGWHQIRECVHFVQRYNGSLNSHYQEFTLYRTGISTGTTRGAVVDLHLLIYSDLGNGTLVPVYYVIQVNNTAAPGDGGSPIYAILRACSTRDCYDSNILLGHQVTVSCFVSVCPAVVYLNITLGIPPTPRYIRVASRGDIA